MINLLDIHISNLIAAGEVVDRPSSALKELVENSIDAKADSVTIEIKGGGISYMRVTDNGEGMSAEDLGRCVLRHATSKIQTEADLAKIQTLGFRGEALAAISSVSDLKIFTRQKNADIGHMLESSSGQNTKITEAGCPEGTTAVLEHLFSKLPARQKFLKRDATEGMYCKWIIEKMALSNPAVSFKFILDGKQKLFTPGNKNYKDAVYSIFGAEIADGLVSFGDFEGADEKNRIKVSGFVSKLENGQKTRANENFFVNGRYVYSKTIMAALEEAYKSIADTKSFPVCALYIQIDESQLDINVHPQKMEIKFSDEKQIFSSVYYAVSEALNSTKNLSNGIIAINRQEGEMPSEKKNFGPNLPMGEYSVAEKTYSYNSYNKYEETKEIEETKTSKNYKILGEAFLGYIFIEKAEKIIVIDKHAAHERIIYDIILKRAAEENKNSDFAGQILLVPAEASLSPEEVAGLLDIEQKLKRLGIMFEWKNDETVLVTEVPPELFEADIAGMIKEAAYQSSEKNFPEDQTTLESLAELSAQKYAACRAAMKSGIVDSPEDIAWLVERVLNYEDVKYCPHGRPVAFEISKSEIEKQFKR
ncbi:MAG: DNA mismatch repair endonuclease MutL [Oscillospiraceae bacterium]|nr:DNA mismatch repair endonuclease MutL [Oscillospiraceae bacterium]